MPTTTKNRPRRPPRNRAKPCQIVDITENRAIYRDGMGSNMGKNLAEEDDRHVVARRIFKALCALYPDRYLMLALPGDVPVLPGDVLPGDAFAIRRRRLRSLSRRVQQRRKAPTAPSAPAVKLLSQHSVDRCSSDHQSALWCPTARSSHIKPWCDSTNSERLNPENGLLLAAHIDALFDRGLISFEGGGSMLISGRINREERKRFRLPMSLGRNGDVAAAPKYD